MASGGVFGGIVGTVIGLVVGWWVSSNFLAGPAAQITGSISNTAGSLMHRGY